MAGNGPHGEPHGEPAITGVDLLPDHLAIGHQNDGAGDLWCAVAHTEWGHIPGKAKGGDCWFPYGGKEHSTRDFHYFDGSTGSAPNEGFLTPSQSSATTQDPLTRNSYARSSERRGR